MSDPSFDQPATGPCGTMTARVRRGGAGRGNTMAYIDFASAAHGAAAIATAPRHDPLPVAAEPQLSALEWLVVAIARRDGLASLRAPGRLSMAMGVLFGTKPNPRLADPKLEALRRLAVLSWHHGFAVPASAVKNFLAAGYSTDQYEALVASIASARTTRKARA
jgi:hypothetical protein